MDRAISNRAATLQALIDTATAPALAALRSGPAHARVALPAAVAPAASGAAATQPTVDLPDPPPAVIDWLARAALLYGVPFEYITPDGRMLPKESIRFFYVDLNWIHRLLEGAVSIGLSTSADSVQMMATIDQLVDQALSHTSTVRPSLRAKATSGHSRAVAALKAAAAQSTADGGTSTGPITGLLIRSAAVSGWPGVEVSAYADDAATQKLPLLRLDRLSDDVLIALFDGLPRVVNFLQPPESLHFGVRPTTAFPSGYMSFLRGLGYGGYPPGQQIQGQQAAVSMRSGAAAGVLDVAAAAASLQTAMKSLGALDSAGTFTAAEFAVQMVRAAGMQSFQWGVSAPTDERGVSAPAEAAAPAAGRIAG